MSEQTGPTRFWRVEVVSTCVGSGLCLVSAPGYFDLHDNRSRPTSTEFPEGDKLIVAAAELCPMEAIVVRDAGTGQPVRNPSEKEDIS
jgi:ferredoxin